MRWLFYLIFMTFALYLSITGTAQTATDTGNVVGHVICEDTANAARFATVRFTGLNAAGNMLSQTTTSDYDGNFQISGVPSGDYLVDVIYPGYIDYLEGLSFSEIKKKIYHFDGNVSSSLWTVTANRVTAGTVTLIRGAVLSGTVKYEDGSPGVQLSVDAVRTIAPTSDESVGEELPSGLVSTTQADDKGNFRLSGLPPGAYTIKIRFQGAKLQPWFLGDTVDPKKAASIALVAGEEYQGINVQLPLTPVPIAKSY